MTMNREHTYLISVGILSGIASAGGLELGYMFSTDISGSIMIYGAGFLYGVVTSLYFVLALATNRKILRFIAWLLASGASYTLAVQTWIYVSQGSISLMPDEPTYFLFAGIVGACILAVAFHFIFQKLKALQWVFVLIAGATIPYIVMIVDANSDYGIFVLYIAWQTAITSILGWRGVVQRA